MRIAHLHCSTQIGHPRFEIPHGQMIFLIESRFTAPQMAEINGVSLSIIRRRMADYGLSITAEYTPFTDAELDRLVEDVQRDFPVCGSRQLQGHLMSRGFRVQQQRIQNLGRPICVLHWRCAILMCLVWFILKHPQTSKRMPYYLTCLINICIKPTKVL